MTSSFFGVSVKHGEVAEQWDTEDFCGRVWSAALKLIWR